MKKNDYNKLIEQIYYSNQNKQLALCFYEVVKNSFCQSYKLAYDIGCGYGLAATYFKDIVSHFILMDTDADALCFVKNKFGDCCTTSTNPTISKQSDLIYFFMSLHHIEEYWNLLDSAINSILQFNTVVAICEIEPNPKAVFHKYEKTPYDGIGKESFTWIKIKYPCVKIKYSNLCSIDAHGVVFQCYSLILWRDV